ncbi:hypothetical protein Zmor_004561 [Zophobas morio]|uniref:Uncharacterized protein n=1 Tax=Zophobas morio TaxID=2755281 RepID=A0AA38MGA0_9CUCU|nr:hypothetical protein Zmor_014593 [Zophobas morio]KAJ3660091.1 hypothetical protein Zmor_004561 [Zophobas morio]
MCNELMINVSDLQEMIQNIVTESVKILLVQISDLSYEIKSLKQLHQLGVSNTDRKVSTEEHQTITNFESDNEDCVSSDSVSSNQTVNREFPKENKATEMKRSGAKKRNKQRKVNKTAARQTIVRGCHDSENQTSSFSAAARRRRAWIYVGRTHTNTTPEDIEKYLQERFSNHNFIVEPLPRREDATSAAFKVGADFLLLDQIYKEENWPRNVIVKKFEFFRHKRTATFAN